MKSLYLRIYATVVVLLLLFAAASGWIFQRHVEQERERFESQATDRIGALGELIERSLPGADAPEPAQADALLEWSQRLRLPLALDNAGGERIAESEFFKRRTAERARSFPMRLEDGRTLWIARPGRFQNGRGNGANGANGGNASSRLAPNIAFPNGASRRASEARAESDEFLAGPPGGPGGPEGLEEHGGPIGAHGPMPGPLIPFVPPSWQRGAGLVAVLVILFVAIALGAFPVIRRLTRRLENLKQGVEQFGAGQLSHRVEVSGRDEVAAVAASFNVAAARVEALVHSHQSLLANASHELRSPLARMKMAVSMLDDASPQQRDKLKREIDNNVAELDALVEEVLLASRLDATQDVLRREPIDLLGLAAEEASRVDAQVDGPPITVNADERLLRRALRNLLENARRYGGGEIEVTVSTEERATRGKVAVVRVLDRGSGVPAAMRERIFEPFFRLPGHAEQAGGVGLGLSLVKQIAELHGGSVHCETREGGGSCFALDLPLR